MTSSKQYWLAGATALISVTGAQAADLPFRKAAPVDYVRVCDAFGAGFFYIPGTDTCLRVTGQVRAEYTFRGDAPTDNPAAFAYNQAGQVYRRDLTSFRSRGYLNADTRTQTAYGALRAFVSIRLTRDSTNPGPIGGRGQVGAPGGARYSTGIFQGYNPSGTQTLIDKAFIQFAGITAGRTQSFFDFDAQSYELLTNSVANSNQPTQMLAYTATFGGGFSATVSVEDATERQVGDNGSFVFNNINAPSLANAASYNNPVGGALQRASILAYGGQQIPDIVANVRYEAEWGSAQISGAYHQLRSLPVTVYGAAPTAGSVGTTFAPSADGFAVSGGVKVLLPMIAKGDSITLQGTYEEGAMDYVNPVNYFNGLNNVYSDQVSTNANAIGSPRLPNQFGIPINDAFVLPNGRIAKNSAVGAYGAYRHYFVPEVYGSVFGAYLDITNPIEAQRLGAGTDSARVFQVGGNLVWTPVKDFQIGAETLYSNVEYRSDPNGLYFGAFGGKTPLGVYSGVTPRNPDDIRTRLSIRRAF